MSVANNLLQIKCVYINKWTSKRLRPLSGHLQWQNFY